MRSTRKPRQRKKDRTQRLGPLWHDGAMPSRRSRVDLTYEDESLLSGVLAGKRVELTIDVPVSNGTTSGTYADEPVTATWHIASNYNVAKQPVSLEASFDGQTVLLTTTIVFRDEWNPVPLAATIIGHIGADEVEVEISRVGDSHRETFAADGHVGPVSIALVANVSREKAVVEGTIDNAAVKLTAKSSPHYPRSIRIRGEWENLPGLGLLATACPLYFM